MWTYLKFDATGEYMAGEKKRLPPDGTAYLGFDALRWRVVIGYTEHGGYSSFLAPNVNDDCNIVAFAPLSEASDPDESLIRSLCPWSEPSYHESSDRKMTLLRQAATRQEPT